MPKHQRKKNESSNYLTKNEKDFFLKLNAWKFVLDKSAYFPQSLEKDKPIGMYKIVYTKTKPIILGKKNGLTLMEKWLRNLE